MSRNPVYDSIVNPIIKKFDKLLITDGSIYEVCRNLYCPEYSSSSNTQSPPRNLLGSKILLLGSKILMINRGRFEITPHGAIIWKPIFIDLGAGRKSSFEIMIDPTTSMPFTPGILKLMYYEEPNRL